MEMLLSAPRARAFSWPWGECAASYGTLDVPRTARRVFDAAQDYLSADADMRDILRRAENAGRTIHLRVNHRNDDSFDARTDTVNWDPLSALRTSEGGRQSPALGLGHELDHATVRASVREWGVTRYDGEYDNAEERRVVCGSERHAAKTLGEDVRCDHRGSAYHVRFPTAR